MHMLTATDLRTSKTAKIKVILLYHCTSSYVNVQQYSNITFIFAVFDVRRSVAVNMCINCSFFYINHRQWLCHPIYVSGFRSCFWQRTHFAIDELGINAVIVTVQHAPFNEI